MMGWFDFLRGKRQASVSDVFQGAFETTFNPLTLPFFKKARLLVALYEAFKKGAADNGAKAAAEITGMSKSELKPLLDRTWRIANAQLQWQRIQDAAENMPYLMLDVTPAAPVREQCRAMDGCARRVDDPYWENNYPPCDLKGCMCRVIQMGDRQIERYGTKVLPPDHR